MEQDTRLLRNPQGTEGLLLDEALFHLQNLEKIQHLFLDKGYLPSRTPSFDYYEVYKDYLEENPEVYRLLDRDGDLLALRSDITLFLAKQLGMTLSEKSLPVRTFYSDTILRHQGQTDISKNEFFQVGAELVGKAGMEGDIEVLSLMTDVLALLGVETFCHIGSRAFFNAISSSLNEKESKCFNAAIRGREIEKVQEVLLPLFGDKKTTVLMKLLFFIGDLNEFKALLSSVKAQLSAEEVAPLNYLVDLFEKLDKQGLDQKCEFRIDLSEVGAQSYYTGISFSVYMDGADSAVAAGGRYDKLLSKFGFDAPSTGFSILLRKIEAFMAKHPMNAQDKLDEEKHPLTIALPKGRLQKKIQELFASKGVDIPFEDRKLVGYDPDMKYKFILVKNGDLPTYVNYGIAGIGVCGTDVIYESGFDFFKPLTFSFGGTTMCLAGRKGENHWKQERPLRVSSKFTHFARDYYNSLGIPVEIVKLNGSVELGAVLGLTPYIVDLVETGSTLVANNLEVFEKLKEIKVKMICNPSYYKVHYKRINELVEFMREV